MKINQPLLLQDKDKTLERLSKLDFIEIETCDDEAIIKRKLSGKFIKIRDYLGSGWIGQIIKDRKTKAFYFCDEMGSLKDVFKLNDWEQIKLFIESLNPQKTKTEEEQSE